jgi:DNA-binding CsgD family transcriptional regulator
MLWASHDYDRSEACYRQALELARASGNELLVAHSLNRLGNWQLNMDRAHLARSMHEEALVVFRAAGDRRGIAETLDFLGMDLVLCGDLPMATAAYREAIDLFRVLDDRHGMASAYATMTERGATIADQLLVPSATLAESLHDAEAALAIARDAGIPADEAYALVHVSLNLAGQGELGRALELTEELARVLGRIDHDQWQTGVHTMLGVLYLKLLDGGAARYHFEQAVELSRQGHSRFGVRMYGSHQALALVLAGSLDEVEPLLDEIFSDDEEIQSITQLIAVMTRAELALARGDADQTLATLGQALAAMPNVSAEHMPVWPAVVRGEALVLAGRLDEAEAALRAAVRDAERQGARNQLWRARLTLGALYQQQGRQSEAERELAAVRAIVEQLAETLGDPELRDAFLARAMQRFPSASATRRRADHAPGLSPRELEVLRLVAEGCSDREVAGALGISHRTAMTHVANILNKLGVSSRTAAVSQALRQGLI